MSKQKLRFDFHEFAGSTGNFGLLFPLILGYIKNCGLNPAGIFFVLGLTKISMGLFYRLPIGVEPMKAIAVVAIAQQWQPSLVYASAFAMAIVWLLFTLTDFMSRVAKYTPSSVVIGIQTTLGLMLIIKAFPMLSTSWALGIISILLIVVLYKNHHIPSALLLVLAGLVMVVTDPGFKGLPAARLSLPPFTNFNLSDLQKSFMLAGLAQIPMTATNAIIATSCLIKRYWPDHPVGTQRLSLSTTAMNLVAPFFGGIPVCHGAGGLAGQYVFGARTGGASVIEGVFELILGLFFAASIGTLLGGFPSAIFGAMLLTVGFELGKSVFAVKISPDYIPLLATIAVSIATNMLFGFLAGIAGDLLIRYFAADRRDSSSSAM